MSCPFYGCALAAPPLLPVHAALIPTSGNQCALITSAHSPCWMEVSEDRSPEWVSCPRNPEFVAVNIFENLHSDLVTGRQGDVRLLASARDLNGLMRAGK